MPIQSEAEFERVAEAAALIFTGPECGWRRWRRAPWGHALRPIVLRLDEIGWPLGRTMRRMKLDPETAVYVRNTAQEALNQSRAGADGGRAAASYDAFVGVLCAGKSGGSEGRI
jgi:hypothetical protein